MPLVIFAVSVAVSALAARTLRIRLARAGIVGWDMNKPDGPEVPEMGGLAIVAGFGAGVLLALGAASFLCDHVGANIDDVAYGLGLDPRIGMSSLRAGLGYGGSCFPKDVRALSSLVNTNGCSLEILRAAIDVNNRQRLLPIQVLRETFGSLKGLKVALLGLAFKPGTDDVREAPALDIARLLVEEGAEVRAYDPQDMENARPLLPREVVFTTSALSALQGTQAVILATEWRIRDSRA